MRVVISDLPPEFSDEAKSNGDASKGVRCNRRKWESSMRQTEAMSKALSRTPASGRHRQPRARSQAADGAARGGARERGQRDHDRRSRRRESRSLTATDRRLRPANQPGTPRRRDRSSSSASRTSKASSRVWRKKRRRWSRSGLTTARATSSASLFSTRSRPCSSVKKS